MGKTHEVKFSGISHEEWGYFLGLFLADGCAIRRTSKVRRRYALDFSLQGNEIDIAEKLCEILQRLELKPNMLVRQHGEYKVNVRVTSKRLVLRLPDKKRLVQDAAYRQRFLGLLALFEPKASIAFLAGLLDGDGWCRVDDYKERLGCLTGSGIGKWKWGFSQTKIPFLIDYIVEAVNSYAPDSVNVHVRIKGSGRRCYEIGFHKSASIALLERGIAKYSVKVVEWERTVARLERCWESEKCFTVNALARAANVDWRVVKNWIVDGKLKYHRKKNGGVGGRNSWFFISHREGDKFLKEMRREKKSGERDR